MQDTTGDVIFSIKFSILAFKPKDNEILDGIVTNVNRDGIEVFSGPIKCFIKIDVSEIDLAYHLIREWEANMSTMQLSISFNLHSLSICQSKKELQLDTR